MVALFGKAKSTISEHLKHIFEEGELDQNSVVRFAQEKAEHEYTIYRQREMNQLESDYDRAVRQLSLFGSTNGLSGE